MIHQYKLNGYNIVLDVYSGSVHSVDDLAYDVIELYENTDREELVRRLLEKYADDPEIDAQEIQKAQEEKKDDDEDEEVRKSKHIFLKIVAVILIICAIFEAAVWGLKQFAPGSAITENAVQIERGIGDALVSLYDTVANWIKGITGGN